MKWFKRRKKVDDKRDYLSGEFSTYEIGGGWGNSIQFTNEKMERVYGFKRARPENGDFLKCPMQSGKTAVWRFCDVELGKSDEGLTVTSHATIQRQTSSHKFRIPHL